MSWIDLLISAHSKKTQWLSFFFFQELAVPLRTYVEIFPNKKFLHPYECSLIELTFGEGNYEKVFFPLVYKIISFLIYGGLKYLE